MVFKVYFVRDLATLLCYLTRAKLLSSDKSPTLFFHRCGSHRKFTRFIVPKKQVRMWTKILTLFLVLHSIEAIFMLTLPSDEVEAEFERLAETKPYLMKSPNDASLSAMAIVDLERDQHRQQPQPKEAKNLVDLAASLNLTV
jgi:hypothetical protein